MFLLNLEGLDCLQLRIMGRPKWSIWGQPALGPYSRHVWKKNTAFLFSKTSLSLFPSGLLEVMNTLAFAVTILTLPNSPSMHQYKRKYLYWIKPALGGTSSPLLPLPDHKDHKQTLKS